MQLKNRRFLLSACLIVTGAASLKIYFDDTRSEIVNSDNSLRRFNSRSDINEPNGLDNRRFLQATTQDIFLPKITTTKTITEPTKVEPVTQLIVAPPIAISPAPILPPAAPINPFIYIGKYKEDNDVIVFLGIRGKNIIVKTGDVLEQTYKIEEIKPPLLVMTYLPLGVRQNIQIGELQ